MPEFRDALGNIVTIIDEPKRIVTLSPSITEILFETGLGERIVGVSAFCKRPACTEQIKKVGSYGTVSLDVLDEIRPDLVLMISGYSEPLYWKIRERYNAFIFKLPTTVFGILELIKEIGIVTWNQGRAKELEYELSGILPSIKKHDVRGYLEINLGGPVAFGSHSYITDALSLFGVRQPYENSQKEWLVPNDKEIIDFDPELLIYEGKMYRGSNVEEARNIFSNRGYNNSTFMKNNNIFVTPGKLDFFAHHGPSFFREVLPWLDETLNHIFQ
ncbi:MAG: ABC transporter substrate-binding protein [Thermoplasmataceae archaeon]